LKQLLANTALMVGASFIALLICEGASRLFLDAGDYLSVSLVDDPVLGMAIAPNSPGFDVWGFRNRAIPSTARVVALGDSHTFGNTALMDEAWPAVLSRQTGVSVYNLGLGGYGPNQYYHLMMQRALLLRPRYVLCGLYMGDDFENAFSITYGLDHWESLRSGNRGAVNAAIWSESEAPGAFKQARNWLSRESLLYRLVVHGALFGSLKESVRFQQVRNGRDPQVTSLEIPEKHIREAFRPFGLVVRLDQSRSEVREGMRITFALLSKMKHACADNGCVFAVVVIPTKETVFADYFGPDADAQHLGSAVNQVIAHERAMRQSVGDFLEREAIPYVDTLPALRRASGEQLYAQTTADMHPNKNGYRVIGETVADFLRQMDHARE
jgi:hypothetical protein